MAQPSGADTGAGRGPNPGGRGTGSSSSVGGNSVGDIAGAIAGLAGISTANVGVNDVSEIGGLIGKGNLANPEDADVGGLRGLLGKIGLDINPSQSIATAIASMALGPVLGGLVGMGIGAITGSPSSSTTSNDADVQAGKAISERTGLDLGGKQSGAGEKTEERPTQKAAGPVSKKEKSDKTANDSGDSSIFNTILSNILAEQAKQSKNSLDINKSIKSSFNPKV